MLHSKYAAPMSDDQPERADLRDELVVVGIAVGLFTLSLLVFYFIESWVG